MIIHNDKLFIEIPRTGTSTVREILVESAIIITDLPRHISLCEYLEVVPEHKDMTKVSIVRNPFDRVASLFEHTRHFHSDQNELSSFDNFVEWYIDPNRMNITRDDIRKTQFDMLQVNGEVNIEYLLRFENYISDVERVFTHVTMVANKFKTDNYQMYYNAETKRKISKYSEIDLDYFKYKF